MSKNLSRVGLGALLIGPHQACCAWSTAASSSGQETTCFASVSTSTPTPFLPRLFQRARAMPQSNGGSVRTAVQKMRNVNGEHQPSQQDDLLHRQHAVHVHPYCSSPRAESCAQCVMQAYAAPLSIYPEARLQSLPGAAMGMVLVAGSTRRHALCLSQRFHNYCCCVQLLRFHPQC